MSSYRYSEEEYEYPDPTGPSQEEWTEYGYDFLEEDDEEPTTPRQTGPEPLPTISITDTSEPSRRRRHDSGSETETVRPRMSSRSSKRKSGSGSKKHHHSAGSSSETKSDNWTDVTDAEERRRIQNRIAQRKFREKAREQKDRADRDARNQQHAGRSYHIPEPEDVVDEEELSGLPWGGPSMNCMITQGHRTASQQGSRRASDQMAGSVEDVPTQHTPVVVPSAYAAASGSGFQAPQHHYHHQATSWSGGDSPGLGGGDSYYGESPFYYDYDTSGGSSRT